MIQEDDATCEDSVTGQDDRPLRQIFPLGMNQRVQVLVQMNPMYRQLSGCERHHAKFELFSDKEIGIASEGARIFLNNLVDSVSIKHV